MPADGDDESRRLRATGHRRGRPACVGNERGKIVVHAKADGQQQGVVVVEGIWPNRNFETGIGINALDLGRSRLAQRRRGVPRHRRLDPRRREPSTSAAVVRRKPQDHRPGQREGRLGQVDHGDALSWRCCDDGARSPASISTRARARSPATSRTARRRRAKLPLPTLPPYPHRASRLDSATRRRPRRPRFDAALAELAVATSSSSTRRAATPASRASATPGPTRC